MHSLLRPVVALFLAACAPAADPAAGREEARVAAVALVEEWAAAGTEGRWDDLTAVYADDPAFTWVEQGRMPYPDHAAIAAGVAQARDARMALRTSVRDIVATPLGADAAAVRANVSIVFGDPAHGGFAFDGILTGVAVRRGERWQFLQGHLSSPPPSRDETPIANN